MWGVGQPANASANPWEYLQPVDAYQNAEDNVERVEVQDMARTEGAKTGPSIASTQLT